jgi:hypothetical protein
VTTGTGLSVCTPVFAECVHSHVRNMLVELVIRQGIAQRIVTNPLRAQPLTAATATNTVSAHYIHSRGAKQVMQSGLRYGTILTPARQRGKCTGSWVQAAMMLRTLVSKAKHGICAVTTY